MHFDETFRENLYAYKIHIYLMKTPFFLHNSLNPRPELLAGMNDDLPVKVGHYI
jgi:hypothetical protein